MIIHNPNRERWVQIDHRTVEDKRLSWKARGMLAYLLSKPDSWVVYTAELTKASPGGRDAVLAGLRELEAAGYIVRKRTHDPTSGKWDSVNMHVYERPQTENPVVVSEHPCGKSLGGKSLGGKSAASKDLQAVTTKDSNNSPLAPTVVDAGEFSSMRQALADVCGQDLGHMTKSELGGLASAAKDILSARGTATDVPRAAAAYLRVMPTGSLMTTKALANHWSRLMAGGAMPASTTPAERAGAALANRGVSQAQAHGELADLFDDESELIGQGLAAYERHTRQSQIEGQA